MAEGGWCEYNRVWMGMVTVTHDGGCDFGLRQASWFLEITVMMIRMEAMNDVMSMDVNERTEMVLTAAS